MGKFEEALGKLDELRKQEQALREEREKLAGALKEESKKAIEELAAEKDDLMAKYADAQTKVGEIKKAIKEVNEKLKKLGVTKVGRVGEGARAPSPIRSMERAYDVRAAIRKGSKTGRVLDKVLNQGMTVKEACDEVATPVGTVFWQIKNLATLGVIKSVGGGRWEFVETEKVE